MSNVFRKKHIKKRCKQDKFRNIFFNKEKFIIKTSVIATIVFVFFLCIYNQFFMPRIDLKGKNFVQINYKEKYIEPGYKAAYLDRDITDKVSVKGKVNSNKLGKYTITYVVKEKFLKKEIKRIVEVKDKSAPNIELVGDSSYYVCPKGDYKEVGYKAIDNYDGDITKKVKVDKKDNTIYYSVSDSSGNTRRISRKLIHKDKKLPEITLNGGNIVYFFVGDKYEDLGFKAIDNCDGDITSKVKISGEVDTSSANTFTIKYSVSDSSSNKTTVSRKVVVSEHGRNGSIYLTFDDGPKAGTTDVILDILKEENVKATFFVTNSGPDYLIQRAYNEGHTIALHTASHNYSLLYSSTDNYFKDLYSVQTRVKNLTGYESKIIRFPGGSSNTISRRYANGIMSTLTKEVVNRGFKYYDWNISSGDAEAGVHTADEIYNNVISRLSLDRVNMVLMHDIKPYTRDSLKRIIQYGKSNGYTFEAISDNTEMITQRVNN